MIVTKSDAIRFGYFAQIGLCLYGARFSYAAITNLQKYEKTAKTLAEWSKEADRQLQLTRTTQTTGALALIGSSIASIILLTASRSLHPYVKFALSPIMLITILFARGHIKNYWAPYNDSNGKPISTRVPLPNMGDYNEAERMTERLLEVLEYLEYSWLATSFFVGIGFDP